MIVEIGSRPRLPVNNIAVECAHRQSMWELVVQGAGATLLRGASPSRNCRGSWCARSHRRRCAPSVSSIDRIRFRPRRRRSSPRSTRLRARAYRGTRVRPETAGLRRRSPRTGR
jgi:hypothetical protein